MNKNRCETENNGRREPGFKLWSALTYLILLIFLWIEPRALQALEKTRRSANIDLLFSPNQIVYRQLGFLERRYYTHMEGEPGLPGWTR